MTWFFSAILAHHTAQAIDECVKKVIAWVTALLLAIAYAPVWLVVKAGKVISQAAVRLFRAKAQVVENELLQHECVSEPQQQAVAAVNVLRRSSRRGKARRCYNEATMGKLNIDYSVQW